MGLEGKMSASTPGEKLQNRLREVVAKIGPYPHARLTPLCKEKKQTTRMKKVECSDCGCIVRMTRKWLEECGPPTCACGGPMLPEEID
jgi:hypothetical protein